MRTATKRISVLATLVLSVWLLGGQTGGTGHNFSIIFEGAIAFHSEDWQDLSQPFWMLMPNLTGMSDGQHQPRLAIPSSAVDIQASTRPPNGHTLDFVYYELNAEDIIIPAVSTGHNRPVTRHPPEVPCSKQEHHCGTIGSPTYEAQYRTRRDSYNWLLGIVRQAPLDNGDPREVDPSLFDSDVPSSLAARMKFTTGLFRTHLLEGEHHPDQLDHTKLHTFSVSYNDGTSATKPVAGSIVGEFTIADPWKIILTKNSISKHIQLHPIPTGATLRVLVTNLPKGPGSIHEGMEVAHFHGFYQKLLSNSTDHENWPVPKVDKLGRAGDEACPLGCTTCD